MHAGNERPDSALRGYGDRAVQRSALIDAAHNIADPNEIQLRQACRTVILKLKSKSRARSTACRRFNAGFGIDGYAFANDHLAKTGGNNESTPQQANCDGES